MTTAKTSCSSSSSFSDLEESYQSLHKKAVEVGFSMYFKFPIANCDSYIFQQAGENTYIGESYT
jgi:hypothetical protein